MNPSQYRLKIQAIRSNLIPWCEEILEAHSSDIKELMRDQMYAGLDGKGELLTPGYSQDPYFRKPGAGARYAAWKGRLLQRSHNSIFPARPTDTPNLIVTGTKIYDRLTFRVGNGMFEVDATSSIISDIKRKYGDVFSLTPLALRFFIAKVMRPQLTTKIQSFLAS